MVGLRAVAFLCTVMAAEGVRPAVAAKPTGRAKLAAMVNFLSETPLQAYIVPSRGDHLSEETAGSDRRLEYLTGFTGSAGTVVISKKQNLLWVDSRYHIQASQQVDEKLWTVMRMGEKEVPEVGEWLVRELKKGSTVGIDDRKISVTSWGALEKTLNESGINLVGVQPNLVDKIWLDQPEEPNKPLFIHSNQYAGETMEEKVSRVVVSMSQMKGDALVSISMDEAAWLTNLRGADLEYSPLFKVFMVLRGGKSSSTSLDLYLHQEKVTKEIREHLNSSNLIVNIKPYDSFWEDLAKLVFEGRKIIIPPKSTSYYIQQKLENATIIRKDSPIMVLKSYKNKVEAEGARKAHIKDAIAICQVAYDIEEGLENGVVWDEVRVSEELKRRRVEQEGCIGSSFPAIVAYGWHSASPHYTLSRETSLLIGEDAPLTIDSGGQYLDGTTDTTRVLHFGQPSNEQKEVYTALLKGVIDLATTVFPAGTTKDKLDFIVRRPLYQVGRGYGHGSTHGTGHFLNVHEDFNGTYLENFVGSQEPGYYQENNFGMRLENLVIVVPATVENFTKDQLLTFEPLTLVPYERQFIKVRDLNLNQVLWLNGYHQKVRELVGKEMLKQNRNDLYNWLVLKTIPYEV